MNHYFAKLTAVGTRSRAGVYALQDIADDETLTCGGDALILITADVADVDR